VFECTAGWRPAVYGQRGEVFINLILGDFFGKAVKAQAYQSYAAEVVVKGALALSIQVDLLMKRFAYLVKSPDANHRLLDDGW